MSRFGQNLRALRTRAGLSQLEVAHRMKLESQAAISLWEKGRNLPEPDSIRRLAQAIQCEPSDLLVGVVTPYDKLRGTTEVLMPDADEIILLNAAEKRLIRLWRRLTAEHHELFLVMLTAAVRRLAR